MQGRRSSDDLGGEGFNDRVNLGLVVDLAALRLGLWGCEYLGLGGHQRGLSIAGVWGDNTREQKGGTVREISELGFAVPERGTAQRCSPLVVLVLAGVASALDFEAGITRSGAADVEGVGGIFRESKARGRQITKT